MEEQKPSSEKPAEKQKIILIRSRNGGARTYTKLDELTAILIILGYDVKEIPCHEYRENTPSVFKVAQWIPTSICGYFRTPLAAARLYLIAMLIFIYKQSMNPILVIVEEISCLIPIFNLYGNMRVMFIDDVMKSMPTLRDLESRKRATPTSDDDYNESVPTERGFRRRLRRRIYSTPKRRFPDFSQNEVKLTDLYQIRNRTTLEITNEETRNFRRSLETRKALIEAEKKRLLELNLIDNQSTDQSVDQTFNSTDETQAERSFGQTFSTGAEETEGEIVRQMIEEEISQSTVSEQAVATEAEETKMEVDEEAEEEQSFATGADELEGGIEQKIIDEETSQLTVSKQSSEQAIPTEAEEMQIEQEETEEEQSFATGAEQSSQQIIATETNEMEEQTEDDQKVPTYVYPTTEQSPEETVSVTSDVPEMRSSENSLDQTNNASMAEQSENRSLVSMPDLQDIGPETYLNEFGEEIDRDTFFNRFQNPDRNFFPVHPSDEQYTFNPINRSEDVQHQAYLEFLQFAMEDQAFNEVFMPVLSDEESSD